MRVIPRMNVLYPCDSVEAKKATIESVNIDGPVYIRLARNNTPIITTEKTPFKIGKAQIMFEPKSDLKAGIIATGPIVYQALLTAKNLDEKGIGVKVLNLSTIKPLDEKAIIDLAKETGKIITVEEHQKVGGMGSAVAELLSQKHPTQIEFVGVDDQFGQSGDPEELINFYGLDEKSIEKIVKKII